jgi:hypothetical protein
MSREPNRLSTGGCREVGLPATGHHQEDIMKKYLAIPALATLTTLAALG